MVSYTLRWTFLNSTFSFEFYCNRGKKTSVKSIFKIKWLINALGKLAALDGYTYVAELLVEW